MSQNDIRDALLAEAIIVEGTHWIPNAAAGRVLGYRSRGGISQREAWVPDGVITEVAPTEGNDNGSFASRVKMSRGSGWRVYTLPAIMHLVIGSRQTEAKSLSHWALSVAWDGVVIKAERTESPEPKPIYGPRGLVVRVLEAVARYLRG